MDANRKHVLLISILSKGVFLFQVTKAVRALTLAHLRKCLVGADSAHLIVPHLRDVVEISDLMVGE